MLPHPSSTPHVSSPTTTAPPPTEPTGTQLMRLVVHQAGPQSTTVSITQRHDVPVLHVRAGNLFVYAGAPEVIAAHLAAWRDTSLAAHCALPAATHVVPAPVVADGGELSVIVRQDDTPAFAVTRYPVDRTRPGRLGCVETVTGPIAVRSYDRRAVTDVLGVWMQAAALGAIVWGAPGLADL